MEKRTGENRIITMPNILSLARILMIPFIILSFIHKEYMFSVLFIVLSGLTDLLDGYIAREYGEITKVGKVLDPVADKLTQLVLLIGLAMKFPFVIITIIIFVLKEFTMGIYNLYFMSKGNEYEGAIIYGKISTMIFYISMILVFFIGRIYINLSISLIFITTIALIISWVGHMIEYTNQYLRYRKEGKL